ncbi:MAG: hypothetical protein RL389_333 [Actinomycetota bacterium]|jgi:hypothetical protein
MADKLDDGYMSPRRRLEQLVSNPQCDTNVASVLLKVRVSEVAKVKGIETSGGISPFAFKRGDVFEKFILRARPEGKTPLEMELVRKELLKETDNVEIVDLRPVGVPDREKNSLGIQKSSEFLARLKGEESIDKVFILAGFRFATDEIPPKGSIELDLMLLRFDKDLGKWVIRIGEVKIYPDRAGLTDPHQLATARAQAGLYRRLLRQHLIITKSADTIEVHNKFFLVLTKPTGSWLSIWPNEDLAEQDSRADNAIKLFEAKWRDPKLVALVDRDPGADEVIDYIANHTKTSYNEGCWSFCELAEHCLRQLVKADDPLILGSEVKLELGEIPIERMLQLMAGQIQPNESEQDLLNRLDDALFEKEGD